MLLLHFFDGVSLLVFVQLASLVACSELPNEVYLPFLKSVNQSLATYEPCALSNKTGCSLCLYRQIAKDLAPWSDGITRQDINRAAKFGVKYQIINGKVYRQNECLFPARCSGIEYFLLNLASKLPDVEIIVNVRDYPQSPRRLEKLPVFSFSKVPKDYYDIIYPAWSFWEGGPAISMYPTGLGRWDIQRKNLQNQAQELPWNMKEDKAFFRGSRTSAERDALVLLSRRRDSLVDAQYTKNQAWKSDKDTLGVPPASEVSLESHCKYRYLFNFRGVAASFRLKHLFLCNSLVFHVAPDRSQEDWIEFFYPMLKPWVHYIPVTPKQLENAELFINFVKDNNGVAEQIAARGYTVIKDHLRMKDVKCYWKKLLRMYSKLQKFDVVRDEALREIKPKLTTSKTVRHNEL